MTPKINQGSLHILIIDDNPEIHKDFIKILTRDLSVASSDLDEFENEIFGKKQSERNQLPLFEIDTASQGQEGVAYVQKALKDNNPYALAFVDIRMPPGWDGIETIKHIWLLDPDIQVVICTAYSDYSWEKTVSELGDNENLLILKKPFDSVAVRQLACALTKKWQMLQDARNYTSKLKQAVTDRTASLQESLSLVKATLESSSDGVLVVNNLGKIIDYNQKFISMWQIPRNTLDSRDERLLREYMAKQLIHGETFFSQLNELYTDLDAIKIEVIKFNDGRVFEYYTQPQKIDKKTVGRVFDFRDITQRVKLEKNLEYQAMHDSLTGLPNRVMLLDRIKQIIIKSENDHTVSFAVLFIDLDRFKVINDSLTHAIGDEVLKRMSKRLQLVIREEDMLARLGGDEFVLIVSNPTMNEALITSLGNIQSLFNDPFTIDNRDIVVTASIGIAIYPKDGKTADILLRNADVAMYRAKEQRGNNFQFYTEALSEQSLAKLDQDLQMRAALTNNEFFLCYQPQFDLKGGKIVAVEALLRWQHPQKGVLLPLDFLRLAEETGLIIQIGEWVLRKACAQNKAWQNAGLPPIRMAVNITAQQFTHQDIVSLVREILQETKLDPVYLELELTENVIVSNPEIIKVLTELKKIGLTIAIDDFGTGYSGLSYLKKIPLDRLKIDGSFVQQIQSAQDDEVIIRAVITMAKNLNLQVLAEGVETQNQLNFLKTHDCEDVQGLYFSKPLITEELESLLKEVENKKITEVLE